MKTEEFSFIADDGKSIHVYHWAPEGEVKACVLVAHGMAEHAARYARLAGAMTKAGYELWAPDHRGHGKTAAEGELGWLADTDGFRRVIEDLRGLAARIKADHPGKKLFLLGHSWGSFLSQGFISLYGDELAGCALSGTAGDGGAVIGMGRSIAKLGCALRGQKAKAPLMNAMSFGSYNKAFKPNRTVFDWLSRDEAEVDAYIADPFCGFLCTYGFFRDLLGGLAWIHAPATMAGVPTSLPIYMFAGAKDPVGAANGSFDWLYNRYKELGVVDLSRKLYPDGRHEVFNDTCRDEATADVIAWLDARA
ncbi:MAG TPA: lysophospholipase [Spirochaetales bacterium]|nr:lysophospholipase [Spirochaetales bacterium]